MTVGTVVLVGLIGGFGAVLRRVVDVGIRIRRPTVFPLGIFAVNTIGSFAAGLVAGLVSDSDATRLLAVGLLGSFTTFSTWMYESERLAEDGRVHIAVTNVVASVAFGVVLAWAGLRIGGAL